MLGALRYEKESGAIYPNDAVLELTPRELSMMHALLARPGHAVTKERLFSLVFPGEVDVQYEAVEVVAYRLRKNPAAQACNWSRCAASVISSRSRSVHEHQHRPG